MDAMIKMLLPMLGLTPDKIKSIIDDLRLTANNYAADVSTIKSELSEIREMLSRLETKEQNK